MKQLDFIPHEDAPPARPLDTNKERLKPLSQCPTCGRMITVNATGQRRGQLRKHFCVARQAAPRQKEHFSALKTRWVYAEVMMRMGADRETIKKALGMGGYAVDRARREANLGPWPPGPKPTRYVIFGESYGSGAWRVVEAPPALDGSIRCWDLAYSVPGTNCGVRDPRRGVGDRRDWTVGAKVGWVGDGEKRTWYVLDVVRFRGQRPQIKATIAVCAASDGRDVPVVVPVDYAAGLWVLDEIRELLSVDVAPTYPTAAGHVQWQL